MTRLLGIDVDGICSDYNSGMRALLAKFGAELRPFEAPDNEPLVWDWYVPYGANRSQVGAAIDFTHANSYWWADLGRHAQMTPTCAAELKELTRAHEVTFITNRPKGTRDATEQWFWDMLDITAQVIVCPHDKGPVLKALDLDAIVEDNYHNLDKYLALNGKGKAILVHRPYNREGWGDSRLAHAQTVEEALRLTLS